MFVGNMEKVYILDKAEGNAAVINGHPAWGSVWYVSFVIWFQHVELLPNRLGISTRTKQN